MSSTIRGVYLFLSFLSLSGACEATAIVVMYSTTEAYFAADSLSIKNDQGRITRAEVCKINVDSGTVVTLAGNVAYRPSQQYNPQTDVNQFYDSKTTAAEAIGDGSASLLDQIKAFEQLLRPQIAKRLNVWKIHEREDFVKFVSIPNNVIVDALFTRVELDGNLSMFELKFVTDVNGVLGQINCDEKAGKMSNCEDRMNYVKSRPNGCCLLYPQSGEVLTPEVSQHFMSTYPMDTRRAVYEVIDWESKRFRESTVTPFPLCI